MPSALNNSKQQVLQALAEQIEQCHLAGSAERELISSGLPALDRCLAEGGLRRGRLMELVAAVPGSGAARLALSAACHACDEGRLLVVVDRRREFYPPAANSLGIALAQMLVVRPNNAIDEAWAIDQALRSLGVGAVLGWPDKLDDHTFRRWQLAAETSGTIGLLIRPAAARSQPSWAEVKLLITPLANSTDRWEVEILRGCRKIGRKVRIADCDHDPSAIRNPQSALI